MCRLYTTGRGYEEFRRPGREGASDGLKHHRLLAYAWGIIDSLDDWRDIDHRVEIRWLNTEKNLQPVPPCDHGRRTRHRDQQRREIGTDYCAEEIGEVLTA